MSGLRDIQRVLGALATGPKNRTELHRALGWEIITENRPLTALLQKMRGAGMVQATKGVGGTWRLADGMEVCPQCHGRGILKGGKDGA